MKILSKVKYLLDKPKISYATYFQKRDTDFEIVSSIQDKIAIPPKNIPEARNRFNGIQYHQPYVNENSCSCHGPAGALSDLTGLSFTVEDIKKIWDQEVALGNASPEWGGYSWKMVDAWRNYWNKLMENNPDMQVCSIAVEVGSELWFELLNKGYSIVSGYRWIEGYNEDWIWDTVVNRQWDNDPELETFGKFQDGGHCLRWAKSFNYAVKNNTIICIDNYKDSPSRQRNNNNIYGIDEKVIKELCEKNIWHEWGYVYMFKSDIEKSNLILDKKLLARLSKAQIDSGRFVNLAGTNRYGIVQFGKFTELKGRDLSEGFAIRNGSINESLVLPLSEDKWISIGGNK